MTAFRHKEIDKEGWETLDVIAAADKFNEWMYQTIKPYTKGKILEIGSGIGNISEFFTEAGSDITLSDIRSNYCEVLQKKFTKAKEVIQLNLVHPGFDEQYNQYLNKFDSIFALNVVEHIKEDALAIKNCRKLLQTGGKLIILVPAYQSLYNRFDKELEHFRRYTQNTLNQLFLKNEFEVIHSQYFNFMGIPGWFVSGKLQKNKTIPRGQISLYNKLVPLFKLIDKSLFNRIGLSVISVGIKK